MLKENGNIRNIFSSYLYGKRLDIYLKDLHEHVLDVKRKGQDGLFLTNRGGWHSKIFTERKKRFTSSCEVGVVVVGTDISVVLISGVRMEHN